MDLESENKYPNYNLIKVIIFTILSAGAKVQLIIRDVKNGIWRIGNRSLLCHWYGQKNHQASSKITGEVRDRMASL